MALVIATLAAPIAAAGAIPDADGMAELREAVARSPVLLVRGDFGLREFHGAWLDSSGIQRAARVRARPALFVSADAPPPPVAKVIPWSEITTMETQRPKKLQGAVGGFVVGLAVGVTLAMNHEAKNSDDFTGVALLLAPPMVGLLGGTILGSLSGTKVIYRAPTQENP